MDTLATQLILEYLNEIGDEMDTISIHAQSSQEDIHRYELLSAKSGAILHILYLLGYSVDLGYKDNKCVYTGLHKVV